MSSHTSSEVTAEQAKAGVLVEALPYIQRFAGATFVVKYGGHAMTDPKLGDLVARFLQLAAGFFRRALHFFRTEVALLRLVHCTQGTVHPALQFALCNLLFPLLLLLLLRLNQVFKYNLNFGWCGV
mgnify:CR=1 FL=1